MKMSQWHLVTRADSRRIACENCASPAFGCERVEWNTGNTKGISFFYYCEACSHARGYSLLGAIRAGDRVTITDRFAQERTGHAVMRGPYGWVLNMGGAHGTPAIASDANIVSVNTYVMNGR